MVSDNEMDEVLLGRPLMKALGFDAIEHLETVSDTYQNMDCSQLGPLSGKGGKLSKIMLRLESNTNVKTSKIAYGDVDEDPVVDGQLLKQPSKKDDEEAVYLALIALVDNAKQEV